MVASQIQFTMLLLTVLKDPVSNSGIGHNSRIYGGMEAYISDVRIRAFWAGFGFSWRCLDSHITGVYHW